MAQKATPRDDLRTAPARWSVIEATFARHAEPSDGWPSHGPGVRRLATELREEDPYRAALILLGLLGDLRRFFEAPDDDSDGGWHRQEAKVWETWITLHRLRRAYGDVRHTPQQTGLRDAMKALVVESPPEWDRTAAQLSSLSNGTSDSDAHATSSFHGEEDVMNEVAECCVSIERRIDTADHAWLAATALAGLNAAHQLTEPSAKFSASDERDAVLGELIEELRGVLIAAVEAGGPPLRAEVRGSLQDKSLSLRAAVRRWLGIDEAEARAEIETLLERRARTSDRDELLDLDVQLVSDLGRQLDDETYLSICRERRWTTRTMERLFAIGRADEAEAVAAEAVKAHSGDVEKTLETPGGDSVILQSFGGSLVVVEKGQASICSFGRPWRRTPQFEVTGWRHFRRSGKTWRSGIGRRRSEHETNASRDGLPRSL